MFKINMRWKQTLKLKGGCNEYRKQSDEIGGSDRGKSGAGNA